MVLRSTWWSLNKWSNISQELAICSAELLEPVFAPRFCEVTEEGEKVGDTLRHGEARGHPSRCKSRRLVTRARSGPAEFAKSTGGWGARFSTRTGAPVPGGNESEGPERMAITINLHASGHSAAFIILSSWRHGGWFPSIYFPTPNKSSAWTGWPDLGGELPTGRCFPFPF